MGIKGLSKLIGDNAPKSIKEHAMKDLFGRKVAIDASMSIYQFMIAVRSAGAMGAQAQLTNDKGEVTSHLQGMFYRTIRMVENGVKPVYVFDGKPPSLKSDELQKRSGKRDEAEKGLKKAEEEENVEDADKFSKRLVKVSKDDNEECKKLLKLMGIPVVQAPGEAEAQCAELCKSGKVWATATEDMDALTFGSPRLFRHMTFSQARKLPVTEFNLESVLEGLELTMDQFIDLCILCGCDYTNTIKGVGPKSALKLIKKHKSLEEVVAHYDEKKKQNIPSDFNFDGARKLFIEPDVQSCADLIVCPIVVYLIYSWSGLNRMSRVCSIS